MYAVFARVGCVADGPFDGRYQMDEPALYPQRHARLSCCQMNSVVDLRRRDRRRDRRSHVSGDPMLEYAAATCGSALRIISSFLSYAFNDALLKGAAAEVADLCDAPHGQLPWRAVASVDSQTIHNAGLRTTVEHSSSFFIQVIQRSLRPCLPSPLPRLLPTQTFSFQSSSSKYVSPSTPRNPRLPTAV